MLKWVRKKFNGLDQLTDDVELLALRDRVEERGLGRDLAAVLPGAVQVEVLQGHLILI